MDGLETEVDALRYNPQGYGRARPVNFKGGVNIQNLKEGVDFEIPDNPDEGYLPDNEHPGEELEKGESFFDDEELFRNLNFESTTQPVGTNYTNSYFPNDPCYCSRYSFLFLVCSLH